MKHPEEIIMAADPATIEPCEACRKWLTATTGSVSFADVHHEMEAKMRAEIVQLKADRKAAWVVIETVSAA